MVDGGKTNPRFIFEVLANSYFTKELGLSVKYLKFDIEIFGVLIHLGKFVGDVENRVTGS